MPLPFRSLHPAITQVQGKHQAAASGRAWDGGCRHKAPARVPQLPLGLDFGHEAVRSRGCQLGQCQAPVLGHQSSRQLALPDAGSCCRVQRLSLQRCWGLRERSNHAIAEDQARTAGDPSHMTWLGLWRQP